MDQQHAQATQQQQMQAINCLQLLTRLSQQL
jgi:hypothetical protein